MNEKFTSNNIKNEEVFMNENENDYKKLFKTLKDISATIALLQKKYLDKF